MKKQFGLSTEIKYVDLAEILANFKNPKFWKKTWCVFKHKDFVCYWRMSYINIQDNTISSEIQLQYHGKKKIGDYGYNWGDSATKTASCSSIPIENSEYTQQIFNKNIAKTIDDVIYYLEKGMTYNSYDYKEAQRLESEEEDRLTEIAKDFLDENNVSNTEIRVAYIDHYVSHASKYNYTGKLVNNSARKYYPSARLMLYSWFNNKDKFDEEAKFLKENMGVTKKLTYEIWKARKELDSEAFIEEAQKLLEDI